MKTIVLATRNRGKLREMQTLLADSGVTCLSLADFADPPEVAEDGDSFLANALKKARVTAARLGQWVLADDSGLEVEALGGAPGIFSARYAGAEADDRRNIDKLLEELKDVPEGRRRAAFCCVLVLCRPGGDFASFEGRWEGEIAMSSQGTAGFGYDPVFFLPSLGRTAAELTPEVKNRLSHRARAFAQLRAYLRKNGDTGGA